MLIFTRFISKTRLHITVKIRQFIRWSTAFQNNFTNSWKFIPLVFE